MKGEKADVRTGYARSPTREGDFAPNASNYDSDDGTDLEEDKGCSSGSL
jgi:hypothetical protein